MTDEQITVLESGIAKMLPIAQDLINAANCPDAEGQYGYITMSRLLYAIKNRSDGMYICTILALRKLKYQEQALQGAMSLIA